MPHLALDAQRPASQTDHAQPAGTPRVHAAAADPVNICLCEALLARHAPVDKVELHWVEEMAFGMWRQRRLQAMEAEA